MCVAIYKPANVKAPDLETLRYCWLANPDGAGFAMETENKNHKFVIRKGFMSFEAFEKAYNKYNLASYKGRLFLHFRIATHGGICAGNTHPFPITKDIKMLQHCNVLANNVLMHNGVLPIDPENKQISDTMELARRLFAIGNPAEGLNLIDGFIGTNKLALLTPQKTILKGDWKEIDGVYFSNLSWQPLTDYDYGYDNSYFWGCVPTKAERKLIKRGVCPECTGYCTTEDGYAYCEDCGAYYDLTQEMKKGAKHDK